MKPRATRITIIIVLLVLAVVGYYAFLSGRAKGERKDKTMTAVEEALSRDLDRDYPPTPKEVMKYYNDILKCYYSEDTTDDDIEALGLKARGIAVVFISHKLDEVMRIADSITVIRDGHKIGDFAASEIDSKKLAYYMTGRQVDYQQYRRNLENEEKLLEVRNLTKKGNYEDVSLSVRKGDILGLTGLLGSGRSELVRAIYGADKADEGELLVNGEKVKINKPLDAMKHGMAYLPEDRKKDGIIADLSVKENIIIALQAQRGMFHLMSKKEMEEAANKYIKLLQIKTASMETPIKSLSGGNQQKVIIARWLLTNPDYLILDEPTRGIDVGTKTEIQKLVLDLADEGKAVTFISSEIEEMLRTCSRMAVLRDGKKVGELSGEQLNQADIMKTIAGGESVPSEVKIDEEVAENGAAV